MRDMKQTLSIYGAHDCSAVYIDKNEDLKILEYERLVKKRYAAFSDKLDTREGIGSNLEERKKFLNYIKETCYHITKVLHNEISNTDIELIKDFFPDATFFKKDHHFSHAICGYRLSGFKEAIILSIDGGGIDSNETVYTRVYHAKDNDIKTVETYNINLGVPYSFIASPISEIKPGPDDRYHSLVYAGKVMGLCAYGQIKNEWIEPLKKFYITNNSSKLGRDINLNLSYNALSGQSGYDLAATSQKVFEEYVHALLTSVLNRFNHDIILVGGCALNVLSNQKIYSWLKNNKPNIKLYVPPNPNDCGLALGQFLTDHPEAVKKANTYCGWDILDKDKFTNYIEERKATPVTITEIVNLIKSGKIIGIIDGCSEVGPRALGNRSIICDPTLSDMKDVLNLKVKFREWYRPFAPVCRLEDKDLYFEEAPEAVYMSYAPKVKEEYRNVLKAITHIDNTSRLQTVTEKQHKLFYNILTELKNRNQIAVILNTSFNIRGKPILTTLQDALYVLDNTQLDYVTSNGFLFKKQL